MANNHEQHEQNEKRGRVPCGTVMRSSADDSPAVARRRAREARTVSQMIALYCAGHHETGARAEVAHCGEPVCAECAALDAYAVLRTQRCRKMDVKTSCDKCENHCY